MSFLTGIRGFEANKLKKVEIRVASITGDVRIEQLNANGEVVVAKGACP